MLKFLLLAVHAEYSENVSDNLGIQRIASYLKQHGIACDLCEIGLEDHHPCLQRALAGEYAVIGLSSTYNFLEQELAAFAPFYKAGQKHPVLFTAGGQAPSACDELWLDVGFDVVVRGYGEQAMLGIAQALKNTSSVSLAALSSVPGISFRHEGQTVRTPATLVTQEEFFEMNYLSELAILESRKTHTSLWKAALQPKNAAQALDTVALYTSQQCPNRCGYCSSSPFINNVYGKSCAYFIEAENVFALVAAYNRKRRVKFFQFNDDDFCRPKTRIKDFCRRVIEAKQQAALDADVTFQCQCRVLDLTLPGASKQPDAELLDLMAAAGFTLVSLGVENFSKRLLETPLMNKHGYDEKLAMAVINAMLARDICPNVNFMICVPEATPDEILFNFAKLIEMQTLHISTNLNMHIYAFPGSAIFSSPLYPATEEVHASPLNGTDYVKKGHVIPHDPRVREALRFYLEQGVKDEIAALKARYGEGFPVRDPYLLNLVKCRAFASRLPGARETLARLSAAVEARLAALCEELKITPCGIARPDAEEVTRAR